MAFPEGIVRRFKRGLIEHVPTRCHQRRDSRRGEGVRLFDDVGYCGIQGCCKFAGIIRGKIKSVSVSSGILKELALDGKAYSIGIDILGFVEIGTCVIIVHIVSDIIEVPVFVPANWRLLDL